MSAPDWVSGLVKELHHPRPAFAVFFACAVCLLLAGPVASWMGPRGGVWLADARPWLLLGLLFSAGLLVWDICRAAGARLRTRSAQRSAINELGHLTRPEQEQLALLHKDGSRSAQLTSDGCAEALAARGILERGEKSDEYKGMRTYLIPPFVWKHLSAHPKLLEPKK